MSTRFGRCVGHSANSTVLETQLESSRDAYLTLFTLIGTHSVTCIDGNKLKSNKKCIEKMTENRQNDG